MIGLIKGFKGLGSFEHMEKRLERERSTMLFSVEQPRKGKNHELKLWLWRSNGEATNIKEEIYSK